MIFQNISQYILQNLLAQLAALFLGIVAGLVVSWFAGEELLTYKNKYHFTAKIFFIATLVVPILFVEKWLPVVFIAISYGVVAFLQKNEIQIFYLVSPMTLFLATQNKEGFFLTASIYLIATMLTTLFFVGEHIKERRLTLFLTILKKYIGCIIVTLLVYSGLLISHYLNFPLYT